MGRPHRGLGGAIPWIAAPLCAVFLPFGAAGAAPPAEPLDAAVFDVSAFPDVLVDVVLPQQFAAETLTPDMITIEGATVRSTTRVDPATVVVSLVIDDSPALAPAVVQAEQGASVELVRQVGEGTEIALATPSGMLTVLTPDRDANIARIAGITAGSPDVTPLPELVLEAATTLAESPETDRRLVIVQGTPIPAGETLDQIIAVVESAGITVDVVAAPGLETGPIADLAVSSGGLVPSAPEMVGEMDRITASIVDRYRVAATVAEPGTAEVALTIDGQRFATDVELVPPPPPPTSAPTTTAVPVTTVPAAVPTPTPTTVPAAAPAVPATTVTTAVTTTTTADPGIGRGSRMAVAMIVAALVVAAFAVLLVLRRRAAGPSAPPPTTAPGPAPPAAPDLPPVDVPDPPLFPSIEPAPFADPAPVDTEPPPDVDEPDPVLVVVSGAAFPPVFKVLTGPLPPAPEPPPRPLPGPRPLLLPLLPLLQTPAVEPRPAPVVEPESPPAPAAPAPAPPPVPVAEPAPAPQPEPEPEPVVIEPLPEPVAIEPVPVPVVEPVAEPVAIEPVPVPVVEPAPQPVAEPEPTIVTEVVRLVEPDPEPEPEPVADVVPDVARVVESEREWGVTVWPPGQSPPDPVVEVEPEPVAAATPLPEPVVEPEPEPVPEPVAEAEPAADPPVAPASRRRAAERAPARRRRPIAQEPVEPVEEPEPAMDDIEPEIEDRPIRGRRVPPTTNGDGRPKIRAGASMRRTRSERRPSPARPPTRSAELAERAARAQAVDPGWLVVGDLRMCRATGEVLVDDHEIQLTKAELAVLELLMSNGGKGVSTEEIIEAAQLDESSDDWSDPDAIVAQLRRKTGVRGHGQSVRKERVLLYFFGDEGGDSSS